MPAIYGESIRAIQYLKLAKGIGTNVSPQDYQIGGLVVRDRNAAT